MFSVRLVIVQAFYAVLVIAALVTITVVFSVLSKNAMDEQVLRLAIASMSTLKQSTVDEITTYERTTYDVAMLLGRLKYAPPLGTTGQNITDYVPLWNVITIPEMHHNSTFLSTFSLWLNTTTNLWYMSGCNRQTELCTLYDAEANTTQFVEYHRSRIVNPIDTTSTVTEAGTPPLYPRYLDAMSLHTDLSDPSWWSYLYIDYAQSVTTHMCGEVAVAKTIDFFYCTSYYTPDGASSSGSGQACNEIVGVTVEATEAGTFAQDDYISASTVYLASTKTVDNVNGACDPNDGIAKAISKFLSSCNKELLDDCTEYLDLGRPYVYTVLGYAQTNGVAFVIADEAPHSFFFSTIERSQNIAIAISVVMIVVVVIMSIIISLSIVIPISFICTSMKNASNLTYERQMAPITRYTIFSEVKQLCASYLDLRQALKDLKSFMPQGLLVGPDEGMDSTSLLSALMGGGRYVSGEDEDEDGHGDSSETDDDDGRGDDGVNYEMAGRAGGYSTPEVTTSADTFIQPAATPVRRQSAAPVVAGASPTLMPSPEDDFDNVDEFNDSPLPHTGRRRSTVHNNNYMSPNGIVSVVAVSTVDEALARDAALQARGPGGRNNKNNNGRRPSSVVVPGVPSSEKPPSSQPQPQQQLQGQGFNANVPPPMQRGRLASSHVRLPRTNESSVDRRVKFRGGYSTINGDSSRNEGNSLRLNRSVYTGDINKFRNVNCTLVCIRFSFQFVDEHSLEREVGQLMNILIKVILRYGGIIEVFRPDVIVVSFGAHAVMSLHTQRATAAAITITKKLTVAQRARTRIIIDTGSFYCGTCGANGRVSPVLFGERFDAAVELLRYDLGQGRLVVTDRVALCLPSDFVVPFDYLVTLRDRSHGCQLFLVLNPAKRNRKDFRESVDGFRKAYTLAISGKYREALEIVSRGGQFDPELASYCVTTFKYLLTMNPPRPRYCRFQLPGFEPLGVTVKEKAPKYQHDRLHLNELEPEDEGHISINFGFGGGNSSSNNAGGFFGGGGNGSQSHVFGEDTNSQNNHTAGMHSSHNNVTTNRNQPNNNASHDDSLPAAGNRRDHSHIASASPQLPLRQQQRRRSQALSQDTATAARSFAVADDLVGSPTDHIPVNESWSRVHQDRKKASGFTPSISRAGDTGRTDMSEEGLPLVFTDHKGERWHRFPQMIGSGAFAEVFKAISENGSLMALKCIHLAATNVQLADVVMEVNTACKLFSDFIVNHIGWAHVGSYMIIIMDYMSGGSLHSAMSAFPTGMTLQVARRYASDSLRGLAYLHRSGVVHADFKPQNILLAADGGCRLSDFGSSVTKANARSSGGDVFHLRGTPAYMSPEVAKGDPPSMKSDMWSFGITLYEILTGKQPWLMKKNAAVPAPPGGSFLSIADPSMTNGAAAAVTAAPAADHNANNNNNTPTRTADMVMEDVALQAVSDVYGVKVSDARSHNNIQLTSTEDNEGGVGGSTTRRAAASTMSPQRATDAPVVEWVPVHGLSDVRFVQGIANGSLQVRVEQADLPSMEAFQLITACLQGTPQKRPISWEAVDHPFFFS